ncbi:MAG: GGDEF domain-containing protein, partial [Xanthomonadales bacterium]|nr:GGDEF domain-containing protein [Xanthomonadales bacterium]
AFGTGLALLLSGFAHAASTATLDGMWRMAQADDVPAQVVQQADEGHMTRFDPSRLQTFTRGSHGAWVVLQPRAPASSGPRILSIRSPMFGRVTLYDAHGPIVSTSLDDFGAALHGHGRLALELPDDWPPLTPILLKFEPTAMIAAPVTFELQSAKAFHIDDDRWLVMASGCFGVMLAMAIMALCFSVILRNLTFAWYAGYLASYAVLQMLQTGYLFHPLGIRFLAGPNLVFAPAIVALTVGFGMLFMLRFCRVHRYAPLLRKPLLALVAAVSLAVALVIILPPSLRIITHLTLNPLLMLCTILTLATAIVCAVRGSRTAWFFLAGWAPLLLLTTLTSAQAGGALQGLPWLNDATIIAGAIEALVLSIGIADSTLTLRRDRDHARLLAERDALTGLLNRRGWSTEAESRIKLNPSAGQVLLFLDLDHFKTLNDCHGHGAGDRALVTVADILRGELQTRDLIGRYGGEEFVVLLDTLLRADAMSVANRLCRQVRACNIPLNADGSMLTISIGLARCHAHDTIASLVERADTAMYLVKADGRNHAKWAVEPAATAPTLQLVTPIHRDQS